MRFCLILLLMLVLCGASFANDTSVLSPELRDKKLVVVDKNVYIGNRQLTGDEFETILKSNDESASAYSTAMTFYYPGMVLAYAGGFALGYGIVEWIWGDSELGMYLTLGGVGVAAISVLLTRIANGYILDAIDIFNKGVTIGETAMRVRIAPTEQGGLGLAFAF